MHEIASGHKKVHLISLGCARNRADSEVILGSLLNHSWSVTQEPQDADAIVVNTCGFIESAKEESVQTVLEAAQLKEQRPNTKIVVAGCLTQRYKSQLVSGLPEVDLFVGTDQFAEIADFLEQDLPKGTVRAKRTHYLYDGSLPKQNTLSQSSAYVKVAEGCQHNCSFCIIPAIRGKLRSRPIPNVVKEVEDLVEQGVKEVNLIAQDLAAYGRDWGSSDLLPLLKALEAVDGLQWIRMLYVYPENIDEPFIEYFASQEKLVKYLDIPVQHGSDAILQKMNRDVSGADMRVLVRRLRQTIPDIAIRTSVMVGFPGETEDDFQQLLDFVKELEFDHLGCFTYSQEEGTVAGRLPEQISEEVKKERQAVIMEAQKEISRKRLQRFVGQTFPVLVRGISDESEWLAEGRLPWQAPEVDGVVYINDGKFQAGAIQNVKITEAFDYDLIGRVE